MYSYLRPRDAQTLRYYRKMGRWGEGEMFRATHAIYTDHNRLAYNITALTESPRSLECGIIETGCLHRPRDRGRHTTIDFRFSCCGTVQGRCLLQLPFVPLCFGIQWNPCTPFYRAFVYIARVVGR
jgi:hypothetical protein